LYGKAKGTVSSTALFVGDLNGDGKFDQEDAKIAAEWTKKTAKSVGDETTRLGKDAMQSDMVKDAAAGAAVGAVIAVPIPFLGPPIGAVIGAALGVYRNFTKPSAPASHQQPKVSKDVYAELLKLDDLRQKGIVSEAEFEAQKKKLLNEG
jgi:hypothetical protein